MSPKTNNIEMSQNFKQGMWQCWFDMEFETLMFDMVLRFYTFDVDISSDELWQFGFQYQSFDIVEIVLVNAD